MFASILDANIHRAQEGLRVIEEYFRFVRNVEDITLKLANLRHTLAQSIDSSECILARAPSHEDPRVSDTPAARNDIRELIKANFARCQEAMRVLEEYTGKSVFQKMRYELYDVERMAWEYLASPTLPRGLYIISSELEVLEKAGESGVKILQLRCKDLPKKDIYERAARLKEISQKYKSLCLINDYIDIAMRIDADGIHTGQDDLDIAELRRLWRSDKIYGRTTHSLAQGQVAKMQGADYVSVGPIWATPSKPDRSAIGFEYLTQAHTLELPYVAIGGIDKDNIEQILAYQPPMIGMIRAHKDLPEILKKLEASGYPSTLN